MCVSVCPAFTAYISITIVWILMKLGRILKKSNFMTSFFFFIFFACLYRNKIMRQRENINMFCIDCDTSDNDLVSTWTTCVLTFYYTSTKSWRGYIFNAVCLCVCVCLSICLSVCVSLSLSLSVPL